MTKFLIFGLYLCFGVTLLVVWPLMAHPSLPPKRKILWGALAFLILVPGGLALYAWLGVPQLAV